MREDSQFAEEVNTLATEINTEIEVQGQGTNTIIVYGGEAYQQNQNKGNIYIAERMYINEKDSERK
jgi:division protein CdvB (Snf7/Vps24/ESCRT-III family)